MAPICLNCCTAPAIDGILCPSCLQNLGIISPDVARKEYEAIFATGVNGLLMYQAEEKKVRDAGQTFESSQLSLAIASTRGFQSARRLLYLQRLMNVVRPVEGTIVECGVGAGESLLYLSSIAIDQQPERRIWGFDSFEGFPELSPEDESTRSEDKNKVWKERGGMNILKVLLDSYSMYGIPATWIQSNMTLVRGFFKDTFGLYTGGRVALLHLDCDLYQSYKDSLEKFYPLVSVGGIIALDEYAGTFEYDQFPGARKAVDGFISDKHASLMRDRYFGKYFLVKEAE